MMIPSLNSLGTPQRRRLPRLGSLGLGQPAGQFSPQELHAARTELNNFLGPDTPLDGAVRAPQPPLGGLLGPQGPNGGGGLTPYPLSSGQHAALLDESHAQSGIAPSIGPGSGGIMPPVGPQAPAPQAPATGSPLTPDNPYPSFTPGATGFPGLDSLLPGKKGHGNAKRINQMLARQNYALFLSQLGPLFAAQGDLINQANTDHFSPEQRSAYLAPRLSQLNGQYQQASGALDRNLAGRGLDSSSAAVSEFANLAGHQAADKANLVSGLFNQEHAQQLQAQAQLRDLIMSIMGRGSQQASNSAQFLQQQQLQQEMLNAQNDPFSQILGALGGLGGMALGGGGLQAILGGRRPSGIGTASFTGPSQYGDYGMPLLY